MKFYPVRNSKKASSSCCCCCWWWSSCASIRSSSVCRSSRCTFFRRKGSTTKNADTSMYLSHTSFEWVCLSPCEFWGCPSFDLVLLKSWERRAVYIKESYLLPFLLFLSSVVKTGFFFFFSLTSFFPQPPPRRRPSTFGRFSATKTTVALLFLQFLFANASLYHRRRRLELFSFPRRSSSCHSTGAAKRYLPPFWWTGALNSLSLLLDRPTDILHNYLSSALWILKRWPNKFFPSLLYRYHLHRHIVHAYPRRLDRLSRTDGWMDGLVGGGGGARWMDGCSAKQGDGKR